MVPNEPGTRPPAANWLAEINRALLQPLLPSELVLLAEEARQAEVVTRDGCSAGDRIAALRVLARISGYLGDDENAFDSCKAALTLPGSSDLDALTAAFQLLHIAHRSHRTPEFLALVDQRFAGDHHAPARMLLRSRALSEAGNDDGAMKLLREFDPGTARGRFGAFMVASELAVAASRGGDAQDALTLAEYAVDNCDIPDFLSGVQNTLAVALLKLGRLDAAAAAATTATQHAADPNDLGIALTTRTDIAAACGQIETALLLANRALIAIAGTDNRSTEVNLLTRISQYHLQLGSLPLYIRYGYWAHDIATELGDDRALLFSLTNIAAMELLAGNTPGARAHLQEAHGIAVSLQEWETQTNILMLWAEATHRAGYPEDALDTLQEVEARAHALADPVLLAAAHGEMASIHAASGSQELAWQEYERAAQQYETLLTETSSDGVRRHLANVGGNSHSTGLRLAVDEVSKARDAEQRWLWLDRAFSAVENARARSLVHTLGSPSVVRAAALPRVAAAQIEDLAHRVRWARANVARSRTSGDKAADDSVAELRRSWQRYESHQAFVEQSYPSFARRSSTHPVSALWARKRLSPNTALIQFAVVAGDMVAIVHASSAAELVRLGLVADITALDAELLQLCAAVESEQRTFALCEQLYDMVIDPIGGTGLLDGVEHLLIIPAGDLLAVPLDCYRRNGEHLVERYTLSYLPSVSAARFLKPLRTCGPGLILADPDGTLPFARREAVEIAALDADQLGGGPCLGSAATKEALFRYAPRARYIHLASHGAFSEGAATFSTIALAGDPADPRRNLEPHDLLHLELDAALVVMSGCDTGLGKGDWTNEMLGFARQFILAGASSVIGARWPIRDASASEFMRAFYRDFIESEAVASALRAARLRSMQLLGYTHPGYWAAYTHFGLPPGWRADQ